MTWDRWLGIAGLVIGIPSFLMQVFGDREAIGWMTLLLIAVIALSAILFFRARNLPPFSMKSVRVTLTLHDTLGDKATLHKEYVGHANHAHISEMSHRNIAADGGITGFQWCGEPVDPSWIKLVVGEYHIQARFPGPLTPRKEFNFSLSYDCESSFLLGTEALMYVVDFPAKTVDLVINFPTGRMCREPELFRVEGAVKIPLASPALDLHRRTLVVKLKRPKVGSEYEIWWRW